jgi:hypothetical protein
VCAGGNGETKTHHESIELDDEAREKAAADAQEHEKMRRVVIPDSALQQNCVQLKRRCYDAWDRWWFQWSKLFINGCGTTFLQESGGMNYGIADSKRLFHVFFAGLDGLREGAETDTAGVAHPKWDEADADRNWYDLGVTERVLLQRSRGRRRADRFRRTSRQRPGAAWGASCLRHAWNQQ